MQDWVKKILSPFKKTSSEEKSESGSFSSWESMNPDELSSETKPRSNLQKTLLNLGVLLAVFLVIMLLQYGVQKFLNVGTPQVAEAPTPEATPEVASVPAAAEPTLPTLAAPVAESPAPEVTPEAAAVPVEASNAEPVVAQNYEPKFNETGEEELPILQEKTAETVTEAAATPVVAQAYEPKMNESGEEELPILQEKTPELAAPTTVVAESYTPQLDASGEEQLPILTEKNDEQSTTVVVLNDQSTSPAPSTETPVAAATPEPAPAPVAEQPAATPAAPVVESPAPVAAPAETAVASSTPVQAAPKRVNAAPATPRQLHSPEWLAKQNAATQKLLAEKAKNPQKNKASVVVKSAHPAIGEQVIMNTEQKRRVTEVPGFIPEENQAIASIGRE